MRLRFQLVPNTTPANETATSTDNETDSHNISEYLEAAGFNVEVEVNHVTGVCIIKAGEDSDTAKNVEMDDTKMSGVRNVIRSMPQYMGDL